MSDDISDKTKLQILWREYETPKKEQTIIPGVPNKMLFAVVIGSQAVGFGPEVVSKLLGILSHAN